VTSTTIGIAWLTAKQVAERIHKDVSTVRALARSGALHGHQSGFKCAWLFADAAVDAHVQGLDDRAQREACGCTRLRVVHRAR
jgi:hypothetical protein